MAQIEGYSTERTPVILSLDTSSQFTSIAIQRGRELAVSFGALLEENRSSRLWSLIDFLLTETGLTINEVDLFSVCIGPGGYTGLRVGITAAKGFAGALERPVVGITSLEAAAAAIRQVDEGASRVLVMNKAYKGEVYTQLFSFDEEGIPAAESEPRVCGIGQVFEMIPDGETLIMTGDAVLGGEIEMSRFLKDGSELGANRRTIHDWKIRKSPHFIASTIAQLAYFRYKAKMTIPPEELQACYVRGVDIKIKQQV
jgi:tRNA threonylcarbamoyl adenosine modification protein YeaZ